MNDSAIVARLRYQGKQYENGQTHRDGVQLEPHILIQAADRIDELKTALNDLLNDCINFDGAKLTDCIMVQASNALHTKLPTKRIE